MPITRRQFELGIDEDVESWMRKVVQFLDAQQGLAFSEDELVSGLRIPRLAKTVKPSSPLGAKFHGFQVALERLVELSVVNAREVAGKTYYATGRFALDDVLSGKVDPYKSSGF